MKKYLLLLYFTFFMMEISVSQNSNAQLKFEEAEEAYSNNNYSVALQKLNEAEKIFGEINQPILYLRILCQDNIISANPLNDYKILENIRKNCTYYLKNYERYQKLLDKYREISDINEKLKTYPLNEIQFNSAIKAAEDKKQAEKLAQQQEMNRENERIRIINVEKEIERKKRIAEIDKYNNLDFFNLGFQSGKIAKLGIVLESIENASTYGWRMSVSGSFIFGETVGEFDKTYVPKETTKKGKFSIDFGPIVKVKHPLYMYAGIGFGAHSDWTLNSVYSDQGSFIEDKYCAFDVSNEVGFENSVGAILRLGRVVCLSTGLSLLNFSDPELTYSISFNLNPKMK